MKQLLPFNAVGMGSNDLVYRGVVWRGRVKRSLMGLREKRAVGVGGGGGGARFRLCPALFFKLGEETDRAGPSWALGRSRRGLPNRPVGYQNTSGGTAALEHAWHDGASPSAQPKRAVPVGAAN